MTDDTPKPKQKTQPRGVDGQGKPHEPVEIPVPKREAFDKLVKRAAKSDQRPKP
jgi:hypothetical protein